ncbi:MAG TPA: sugar transferase [Candidatus Saccharimonadales bacterium]|nr:sugar transferase [Candidatus Saccharimonadales bacterium]
MLFRQERIGKGGVPFDILKLKTMPGQDHSGENEAGGSEHSEASLLSKFCRKSAADELPQCINVILGNLHLVGVRPQTPITLEQRQHADPVLYEDWFWWATLNPGVVGPGQGLAHVHQGAYTESSELVKKVMRADVNYCEKASLKQDIACIATTPIPVVRGLYNMLRSKRAENGVNVENKSSTI